MPQKSSKFTPVSKLVVDKIVRIQPVRPVAGQADTAKCGEKQAKLSYSVHMICNNCQYHGQVHIPFGKTVAAANAPCPNCGCTTLVKSEQTIKLTPTLPPIPRWPDEERRFPILHVSSPPPSHGLQVSDDRMARQSLETLIQHIMSVPE